MIDISKITEPSIYTMDDLDVFISELENIDVIKKKKKNRETKKFDVYEYYNVPAAFDIEVTSHRDRNGDKIAFMYIWQFGIGNHIIYGRTWDEFIVMYLAVVDKLQLNVKKRWLIVYVHNLPYEFQFICKRMKYINLFCSDNRKPMYAQTESGIEFRCSYILSASSLEKVGEDLTKYKVNKKVGQLDYEKIRTPKTPLTNEELEYCIYDIIVAICYIQERIEYDGNITKLPLTNTGYVRNFMREKTLQNGKNYSYRQLIRCLTLEPEEYILLKDAFMGGFTHANAYSVGIPFKNVSSYDFTSSYPAVMVCEMFPMSKGRVVKVRDRTQFFYYMEKYCCVFRVKLTNLVAREDVYEHPLSESKCVRVKNAKVDNGRLISCDSCLTTLTNVDFQVLTNFYKFGYQLGEFIIYDKAYLPREFVEGILELYQDKTMLKDVENRVEDYTLKKGMLNSSYGMTIMDIVKDISTFDGNKWTLTKPSLNDVIDKYNNNANRFLFYPWGVFITAYARRNLFTAIKTIGYDYIYSDTDSVKFTNHAEHKWYFEDYNRKLEEKMIKAMNYHKFDLELYKPKTIKGEEKPLGFWDYEGTYKKFKTLGAKRYMFYGWTKPDGKYVDVLKLTVSGVNKKKAADYISKQNNPFDFFDDKMLIPMDYSGRTTHTYMDYGFEETVVDYLGIECDVSELSSVHIEKSDFNMTMSPDFITYVESLCKEKI